MITTSIRASGLAILATALTIAPATHAQTAFPSKPIRFVVPSAQGGNADILTRIIGDAMSKEIGQSVIVDNRPGGSGTIGTSAVANAAPDGYTILMTGSTFAVVASLFGKLPYDPIRDFSPVSMVGATSIVLVANTAVPIASIKDLIALAQAKPGTLNYGSSGNGSPAHLAGELLGVMTGIKLVHVPYKSMGPGLTDTIGGSIQLSFPALSLALPFLKTGKLRALGITDPKRSPLLPEVPAIAESVPGYQASIWNGVLAPANTPRPVITRINAEIAKAVNVPEVRTKIAGIGVGIETGTPEEFGSFLAAEIKKWPQVIKEAGIKLEIER